MTIETADFFRGTFSALMLGLIGWAALAGFFDLIL
jgi:hypothetical protein